MLFLLMPQIVYNLKQNGVARGSCRLCSLPEPTVSTMHTKENKKQISGNLSFEDENSY